ncbi:MAG: site-specific integrase [Bacteroidota bacterium]
MAHSVKVFLDTRHPKKDGTYSIKLRIRVNGKAFELRQNYAVDPKHWDEDKKAIKTTCKSIPNVTRANLNIIAQKMHALNVLSVLEDEGKLPFMSLKEVKTAVLESSGKSPRQAVQLLNFGSQIVAELKTANKVGNARVYQTALNSLSMFLRDTDIPFQRITFKWLKQYEAWYLSRKNSKGKPNSTNGLSVHMRTLRAIYNRAIKEHPKLKDSYPFHSYSIKHEKTRKRAIGEDAIAKLKAVEPQTARQRRAKDYFLMSFYLMGASFIDLAFLTYSNIKNGRIEYKRKKTGQLHSIKITAPLQAILDIYIKEAALPETYILPVVKGETEEQRYTAARDELRRYNRALKELAALAGVDGEITSYTARHSFATIAKYKGVPVAVISEALGHESTEVTQVYLDSFDTAVLDRYNELVIGG